MAKIFTDREIEIRENGFQNRVIAEKGELDVNRYKLNEFGESRYFTELPDAEQDRLIRQLEAMDLYSSILGERIEAFGNKMMNAEKLADALEFIEVV